MVILRQNLQTRPPVVPRKPAPQLLSSANLSRMYFPGWGIPYSILFHCLIFSAAAIYPLFRYPVAPPVPFPRRPVITWIKPAEVMYLPILGGGSKGDQLPKQKRVETSAGMPAAQVPRPKTKGLSYPGRQPILSDVPNPTNAIQTLLQPGLKNPQILPPPLRLPNLVQVADVGPAPHIKPLNQGPLPPEVVDPPEQKPVPPTPVQPELKPAEIAMIAAAAPAPLVEKPKPTPPVRVPQNIPRPEPSLAEPILQEPEPTPPPKEAAPPPEPPKPAPPAVPAPKPVPADEAPPPAPKLVPPASVPEGIPKPEPKPPQTTPSPAPPPPKVTSPLEPQNDPVEQPKVAPPPAAPEQPKETPASNPSPAANSGADRQDILALTPVPAPPKAVVEIPAGEARGRFAISPEPNLSTIETEPGGISEAEASPPGVGSQTAATPANGIAAKPAAAAKPVSGPGAGETNVGGSPNGAAGSNAKTAAGVSSGPGTGSTGAGAGAGPRRGAFAGITIVGGAGTTGSATSSSVVNLRPAPRPLQTTYGLTVLSTESSGGGLPSFGVFQNEQIYTVYLDMRQTENDAADSWPLEFSVIKPAAAGTDGDGAADRSQQGLVLPFPAVKEKPALPAELVRKYLGRMIIVYAIVNLEGKMEQIQVKESPDPRMIDSVLQAMSKWVFRPARMNGEPAGARVLLGIPLRLPQ